MHPRHIVTCAIAIAFSVSAGATVATAAPAGRDARTEAATAVTVIKTAIERSEVTNNGCAFVDDGTAIGATCNRDGSGYLVYDFTIPAAAINARVESDHTVVEATKQAGVYPDFYRKKDRLFRVNVGVVGPGSFTLRSIALTYDLPTERDTRPCVTAGEWARINVGLGGRAGTRDQVHAVFDTPGRRVRLSKPNDGFQFEVRAYTRCDSKRTYKVTYHHNAARGPWYSYWG